MNPGRRLRALQALAGLLLCVALQAGAQMRGVALVIGNGAYADRPLPNPINDATDMAAALREAGFEVIVRGNLNESAMKEALADFEDRLRATRGIGVFYFAGHGMQTSRGQNYLLPVGRSYQRERDVELFGVAANAVLASMEKVGNALNIVILDACRDAPLPAEQRGSSQRGLARMDAPSGSVIAFATAPGRTASDNPGSRNGLYTQHLLRALRTPGQRLEDVFKDVGRAVERDSGGQQSPEEFMKLRDLTSFCFFPGRGCGASARVPTADEVEAEYWDAVKASRDLRDFQAYLQRYPGGRYALLAQRQVRLLEVPAAAQQDSSNSPVSNPYLVVATTVTAAGREKVVLSTDIPFFHGAKDVPPLASDRLNELAARADGLALEVIIAVGHASAMEGDPGSMLKLSLARAEAVRDQLVARGVERNRVYTEGKGDSQPVADNKTAEGRAKNRRVEVEVIGIRKLAR